MQLRKTSKTPIDTSENAAPAAEQRGTFSRSSAGGMPAAQSLERAPTMVQRLNASRSLLLRGSVGAMLVVTLAGGIAAVDQQHSVTLTVDGKEISLNTLKDDVGGALASAGYEIGEHDKVMPPLGTALESIQEITLLRARPVQLSVDGESSTMWTTKRSVGEAVAELTAAGEDAAITPAPDSEIPLDGAAISVVTVKDVNLVVSGRYQAATLSVRTVAEVLEASDIIVGTGDIVLPSPDTTVEEGMTVSVTRVERQRSSHVEPVTVAAVENPDPELEEGNTVVEEPGTPGIKTILTEALTIDGVSASQTIISETLDQPAVPAVVRVGTKPAPQAPAAASGSVWDTLAQCESGGNWSINTGNGYTGGLQFSAGTWAAFGGTVYAPLAHMASRAQQIDIAQKVQAGQGWGAWPACTSKMGIR